MDYLSPARANEPWERYRCSGNPECMEAIDELYRALRRPLMEFCKLKGCGAELADEIAEQAFFRLMQRRPSARNSFLQLLRKTAQNLCLDAHKSARVAALTDPPPSTSDEPSASAETAEAIQAVRECLDLLNPAERLFVASVDAHGLTQSAACELVGWRIAPSTCHHRYQQIRQKLARCLKEKNIF